jgi:transcriptional regulator with XRE-family HTH domain
MESMTHEVMAVVLRLSYRSGVATKELGVGSLLREWRQARRLSQLALASTAGVSTRHLSFVETGRSRPSPELVLHLAAELDIPLRARNQLLLAAGYAPAFRVRPLDDPTMAPVAMVLDAVLERSEPNPTVIVDGQWNLLRANAPALWLCTGVDPALLAPPANVARLSVDPAGLRPRIRNFAEYAGHLAERVRSAAAASRDPELTALARDLAGFVTDERNDLTADPAFALTMHIEVDGHELALFSTIATFGTAFEVGLSELSIETFYPADDLSAEVLEAQPWH